MAGLGPAIHASAPTEKAWMPAPSAGMTRNIVAHAPARDSPDVRDHGRSFSPAALLGGSGSKAHDRGSQGKGIAAGTAAAGLDRARRRGACRALLVSCRRDDLCMA